MNGYSRPAKLALIGLLAVSLMETAAGRPESVNTPLTAVAQNVGKIAVATLVPTSPTSTELVLFVSGLPTHVSQPAQLYTYIYRGSCANREPSPAYSLNQDVRLGDLVPMRMWKSIPLSLSDLRSGNYAIVLRTSPADGYSDVFCGSLG
jgi:hypothetical protein